jgi:hypothetical protein
MNSYPILENRIKRKKAASESIKFFAIHYLKHYLTYRFAPFHNEIFRALEDEKNDRLGICAFRESAKSSIINTIYVLWNICFNKRKFIVLGSEESGLSSSQTTAVAYELLFNERIIEDFGNIYYDEEEGQVRARKRSVTDFTTRNGIRIKAISWKAKFRGLRHGESRPDLVILDDMDNTQSVSNPEIREKKYVWFKSEVLSGINQSYGKVICLGNMIHYDCFMARIRVEKNWNNIFIPIYDKNKEISWADKYVLTHAEAIATNKDRTKSEKVISIQKIKEDKGTRTFNQEYLLVPATDEDRIFKTKFIEQCLNFDLSLETKRETGKWDCIAQGNDLAISDRKNADNFVITTLGQRKSDNKIVLLNIYRDKNLSPNQQISSVKKQHSSYESDIINIEDNAYQAFFSKLLQEETNLQVKGFRTGANKKDEIIGINSIALALENKNIEIPYGDEKTKELVDELIREMQEYPDGHTGDILMSFWFAYIGLKQMTETTDVDLSVSSVGLYRNVI